MLSVDRHADVMTEEQRSDAAMRDDRDVASARGRNGPIDCAKNAFLRVPSGLPATNADIGVREELVRRALELWRPQETGCRPVVLTQLVILPDVNSP